MRLAPQVREALEAVSNPQAGTWIITPRRRLARQIRDLFCEDMSLKNQGANYSPRIVPISEWIAEQGKQILYDEQKILIDGAQASLVWEEAFEMIVRENLVRDLSPSFAALEDGNQLKTDLIGYAAQAWRDIHLYRLALDGNTEDFTAEVLPRFFLTWSNRYRDICDERMLSDEMMLLRKFEQAIVQNSIQPDKSLWVGFDKKTMPPAYAYLYDMIAQRQNGEIRISILKDAIVLNDDERADAKTKPPSDDFQPKLYLYERQDDELESVARRVRELHLENPDKLIGVVVPGMEQNWHQVRNLFSRTLDEEQTRTQTEDQALGYKPMNNLVTSLDEKSRPFDMSWGDVLAHYPLIGDLIRLLSISPKKSPPKDLLGLFTSPYITGYAKEIDLRSKIDDNIAKLSHNHDRISLAQLVKSQQKSGTKAKQHRGKSYQSSRYLHNLLDATPILSKCLSDYFDAGGTESATESAASPRDWSAIFAKQAEALGWGNIESSSMEVQLWNKWNEILDALYKTSNVTDRMKRRDALAFVTRAAEAIFQPQPPSTKVKLLGLSEAEGMKFDSLFVCHANSGFVPQRRANFFIPPKLAKAAGLGGIQTYLKDQERVIDGLRNGANEVYFSCSLSVNDEESSSHPLLDDIETVSSPDDNNKGDQSAAQDRKSLLLESLDEKQSLAVSDSEYLHGLISLVKSHAACPFQSFVRHRLHPGPHDTILEELSPLERGTIFHDIMCRIWTDIKDQKTLVKLSEQEPKELSKLIETHTKKALNNSDSIFLQDDITYMLESRIMTELADRLLENELLLRDKPYEVLALESTEKIEMGGREYSLKIDRIDRILENDQKILIDYKLGKTSYTKNQLLGDRPDEPSLLIYSMQVDNLISLGLMAITYKKEINTPGLYLENEGLFSTDKRKSEHINTEILDFSKDNIKNLYTSFMEGNAQVDPKTSRVCTYCDCKPICRIFDAA